MCSEKNVRPMTRRRIGPPFHEAERYAAKWSEDLRLIGFYRQSSTIDSILTGNPVQNPRYAWAWQFWLPSGTILLVEQQPDGNLIGATYSLHTFQTRWSRADDLEILAVEGLSSPSSDEPEASCP